MHRELHTQSTILLFSNFDIVFYASDQGPPRHILSWPLQ